MPFSWKGAGKVIDGLIDVNKNDPDKDLTNCTATRATATVTALETETGGSLLVSQGTEGDSAGVSPTICHFLLSPTHNTCWSYCWAQPESCGFFCVSPPARAASRQLSATHSNLVFRCSLSLCCLDIVSTCPCVCNWKCEWYTCYLRSRRNQCCQAFLELRILSRLLVLNHPSYLQKISSFHWQNHWNLKSCHGVSCQGSAFCILCSATWACISACRHDY